MADFLTVLMDMKNGKVAKDLDESFQKVREAVLEFRGKGELGVKFKIQPQAKNDDGDIVEVAISYETVVKCPRRNLGPSTFFVGREGELTRQDPNQMQLDMEPQKQETR